MGETKQESLGTVQPDDSEPSVERQAQLRAACEQNVAQGHAPYQTIHLRTRGELCWVMAVHSWDGGVFSGHFDEDYVLGTSPADLRGVNLRAADLRGVNLGQADLSGAWLAGANLAGAHLLDANLSGASLRTTILRDARLQEANLSGAMAADADFSGAWLPGATLTGADLRRARFDGDTVLTNVKLDDMTRLGDVRWNGVPVTSVEWRRVQRLGDEFLAQLAGRSSKATIAEVIQAYEEATRAYRQLAVTLRSQGLHERADAYAYRAHLMHRVVLRRQAFASEEGGQRIGLFRRLRKLASYGASCMLDLVAGYGYRPLLTLLWYVVVIGSFALAYFAATHGLLTFGLPPSQIQPLHWYEALVLSVSSFHGRGFFQPVHSLGDPVAILAAIEAVFGLFIEVSFIATFTQRYFGK